MYRADCVNCVKSYPKRCSECGEPFQCSDISASEASKTKAASVDAGEAVGSADHGSANTNTGVSNKDRLLTLHANAAYLMCGCKIMQEIFQWIQEIEAENIETVEKYLRDGLKWEETKYNKIINQTGTREQFSKKGIKDINFTALWKLFHEVLDLFKQKSMSTLEKLLNDVKDERNRICHSILIGNTVTNQDKLKDSFGKITRLRDDILEAFELDERYRSRAQEEKKAMKDANSDTLESKVLEKQGQVIQHLKGDIYHFHYHVHEFGSNTYVGHHTQINNQIPGNVQSMIMKNAPVNNPSINQSESNQQLKIEEIE